MKKIFALTALMVLSVSSYATADQFGVTAAGAAVYGGADSTAATNSNSPLFKLSTGVSAVINFDALGVGYAVFTKHVKGTKTFGTAYDSTAISWVAGATGLLSTTTTGTATVVPAGWTTM